MDMAHEAVSTAIDAARPGVLARDLDAAARRAIEKAGYGEAVNHQLSPGIGLQSEGT